ncbi:hypothetical protein JOE48_002882 [Methylobacterium sp. PvR107]|nr:hypothetical protein [Methylobacterium sp. PvR107]
MTNEEIEPAMAAYLKDEATTPSLRRTMVMTAVIMNFPVQG